jgi:tetratricopeptide (TPR) repeat protein
MEQKASPDAGTSPIEEPSHGAQYERALALGRRATAVKKWQQAIEAFTSALALEPHDSRALAERGYARMLADDLEGARADFEQARRAPADSAVLASILHNLGMLEERAGKSAKASEFTAQAKRVRRNATLGKSGKGECPMAEVEAPAPERFDSFMAIATAMDQKYPDQSNEAPGRQPDIDEASAQYRLTNTKDPKARVFIVGSQDSSSGPLHLVALQQDGKLAMYWEIGPPMVGLCGGKLKTNVTTTHVAHVVVDAEELMRSNCGGDRTVHNCCVTGSHEVRHLIYDLGRDKMVLQLVETLTGEKETYDEPRVDVFVQDDQVMYIGAGCDNRSSFSH